MSEETPNTGQATPPNGSTTPPPSAEAQAVVANALGAQPPAPQGPVDTPQDGGEQGPPILSGEYRVPLDGGQRHVTLTPEETAQLIELRDRQADIEAAQRTAERTIQESALHTMLGQRLQDMEPQQRERLIQSLSQPQQQAEQQPNEQQGDDIDQLLGTQQQQPAQPARDPRLDQMEQVLSVLAQREQAREQQQVQETQGQQVDRAMAEHSVFKTRPDGTQPDAPIAPLARQLIMQEVAQAGDQWQAQLPQIVARAAQQSNQVTQGAQQQIVQQLSHGQPTPPAAPPSRVNGQPNGRPLTGEDLRNGGVRRAIERDLGFQGLFAPGYRGQ